MPDEIITAVAVDIGVNLALRAAGKIAPLAKPIVERLFHHRFENQEGSDVATAAARLEPFMAELDVRVRRLEAERLLSEDRLQVLFARPEITGSLYSAFESAMETNDLFMHKTLADLVVERLRAEDEPPWAPAARIAIERMRDLTSRQVRILALVQFLRTDPFSGNMESIQDEQREWYVAWLQQHGAPLIHQPREYADIAQLRGLGLLEISPEYTHLEGGFTPPPLNAVYLHFADLTSDKRVSGLIHAIGATASSLRQADEGVMLAACELTPAGQLIAINALREGSGLEVSR